VKRLISAPFKLALWSGRTVDAFCLSHSLALTPLGFFYALILVGLFGGSLGFGVWAVLNSTPLMTTALFALAIASWVGLLFQMETATRQWRLIESYRKPGESRAEMVLRARVERGRRKDKNSATLGHDKREDG